MPARPFLSLTSVSFGFTSDPLFTSVDLDLGPGWHGLVGPNGAGKTTLLALMAGVLRPHEGHVTASGPVLLSAQTVDALSSDVIDLARSFDSPDFALRGRLGLEPDMVERWTTLSPGERRRWQIAAAVRRGPDVLLLDEPTNHLDREALAELQAVMRSHGGVGVVVSHDRSLLDGLTTSTIRVVGGSTRLWSAPYTVARQEWKREEERIVREADQARSQAKRLERRLADARRETSEKQAAWSRSQRLARPGDHDATSTSRTAKYREGEAAAGARLSALRAKADRAAAASAAMGVDSGHRGRVKFGGPAARRDVLVRRSGPLVVDDHVLVDDVAVTVGRASRLRIVGPNGSGKTTLMESLVRQWSLPEDRLFHLPQDLTEAESARALVDTVDMDPDQLGRVMQLYARLGGEPALLMASSSPSPGEVRKLLLASALTAGVWCLMLDEPTNHLDLDTTEALEDALRGFDWALVVITHDERFADAVTTERFSMGENTS